MAEVPEVETIVRDLQAAVVGRTIAHTEVLLPAAVRFPDPDGFVTLLQDRAIEGATRRAKHILMPLDRDFQLAVHFMLWGTLTLTPAAEPRPRETLIVWTLDGGDELRLLDTLGYARAAVGSADEVRAKLDLDALGPEALDPDFDADLLARQLAKRRGPLKTVLLNQKVLAGLGNRDADESLWLAQIDPRRAPSSLSGDEIAALHAAICRMLHEGIALRGTQRDLFGVQGRARHRRYIFERTGRPCPRCSTPVEHLRIGGRNTHFCPHCQR